MSENISCIVYMKLTRGTVPRVDCFYEYALPELFFSMKNAPLSRLLLQTHTYWNLNMKIIYVSTRKYHSLFNILHEHIFTKSTRSATPKLSYLININLIQQSSSKTTISKPIFIFTHKMVRSTYVCVQKSICMKNQCF